MKNIILGMFFTFFIVISVSIIFTIDGRRIRKEEVIDSLSSAIESSMKTLTVNKYSIANKEEFVADLLQAILVQIESDSTIEVKILDADSEKGLLSIEVIGKFQHPNGKPGTVSAYKTVIFEPDSNISSSGINEEIKITYLLPGNILYKEYTIKKGSEIIIPKNPTIEAKTFLYWCVDGSNYQFTDEDNNKARVEGNITLIAEFGG